MLSITLLSFVLFSAIAIRLYKPAINLKRKVVPPSPIVTVIDKNSVVFPSVDTLKRYYEPKPNSIIKDKPNWLPYTATYTINKDGLNNSQDFETEKPKDVFRIVALGDSFTFGAHVNTKDNYVSQLMDILGTSHCNEQMTFEVLNLGEDGYDIQYEVERFATHGVKYNPDLVIWLVNNHNLLTINELMLPLRDDITNQTSISAKTAFYAKNDYYFATGQARDQLLEKYGKDSIYAIQKTFLNRFSSLYSGPVGIFMFSNSENETKDLMSDYASSKSNGYFFDLKNIDEHTSLPDGHPNTKGHIFIAKSIYDSLIEKKLIPCKSSTQR